MGSGAYSTYDVVRTPVTEGLASASELVVGQYLARKANPIYCVDSFMRCTYTFPNRNGTLWCGPKDFLRVATQIVQKIQDPCLSNGYRGGARVGWWH